LTCNKKPVKPKAVYLSAKGFTGFDKKIILSNTL
jgi:hypothetical protein